MSDENFDIIDAGIAGEHHAHAQGGGRIAVLPVRVLAPDDEPEDAFLAYGHSWFR